MRKLLLSIVLMIIGCGAFAQKPSKGDYTIETQFILDLNGKNGWTTPYIRGRYFINEAIAARLALSIVSTSSTKNMISNSSITPIPVPAAESGSYKESGFGFGISLGMEKHFAGTEKLSPFVGGDFIFTSTGAGMDDPITGKINTDTMNVEITGAESRSNVWTNKNSKYTTTGGTRTTVGLKLLVGADYYFTTNIYIGSELGWGFMYSSYSEQKETGTRATTSGTPPAIVTTPFDGLKVLASTSFDVGMYSHPLGTIRFGIKF